MDRDNRKSHLAPQLSPATQELLRSSDSPTYLTQAEQTPTSGEIPILGSSLVSLRDQLDSVPTRSPIRNGSGAGRPGGSSIHPGLGSRVTVGNPVPGYGRQSSANGQSWSSAGSRGSSDTVFSLPIRPAPPAGPLPPPPPSRRQPSSDDVRKENQR